MRRNRRPKSTIARIDEWLPTAADFGPLTPGLAPVARPLSGAGRHLEPALAQGAGRELGSRGQVEPFEQPAQVRLHGLRADPEPSADLVVGPPLHDEADDIELALAH